MATRGIQGSWAADRERESNARASPPPVPGRPQPGRTPPWTGRCASVASRPMTTTMATLSLPPRSPADLDTWLATNPPADVAIGLALPVAGLLVAYLTVVGVLYLLAVLLRAPRAVRALARVTPAGIRAVAERTVAVGLLTATWAAPAAAADAGGLPPGLRVPATADSGVRAPALVLPTVPGPTAGPPTPEAAPPPLVAPPRRPAPEATAPARRVTVAAGDHLWGIAARALADARGTDVRQVAVGDVAGYWAEVVRTNRASLRSGDPDVIHPGEEIRLPPVGTDDR